MFIELVSALAFDLAKTAVGALLALLAAKFLWSRIDNARFGGWTIRVLNSDGSVACERSISVKKIQQILDDEADLSVFVKGVASTYGWVNCDPCTTGRQLGLLTVDAAARRIIIDLAKNPPKAGEKRG